MNYVNLIAFHIEAIGKFLSIRADAKGADTAKDFSLCQFVLIK
jgi:hypothetical protein